MKSLLDPIPLQAGAFWLRPQISLCRIRPHVCHQDWFSPGHRDACLPGGDPPRSLLLDPHPCARLPCCCRADQGGFSRYACPACGGGGGLTSNFWDWLDAGLGLDPRGASCGSQEPPLWWLLVTQAPSGVHWRIAGCACSILVITDPTDNIHFVGMWMTWQEVFGVRSPLRRQVSLQMSRQQAPLCDWSLLADTSIPAVTCG